MENGLYDLNHHQYPVVKIENVDVSEDISSLQKLYDTSEDTVRNDIQDASEIYTYDLKDNPRGGFDTHTDLRNTVKREFNTQEDFVSDTLPNTFSIQSNGRRNNHIPDSSSYNIFPRELHNVETLHSSKYNTHTDDRWISSQNNFHTNLAVDDHNDSRNEEPSTLEGDKASSTLGGAKTSTTTDLKEGDSFLGSDSVHTDGVIYSFQDAFQSHLDSSAMKESLLKGTAYDDYIRDAVQRVYNTKEDDKTKDASMSFDNKHGNGEQTEDNLQSKIDIQGESDGIKSTAQSIRNTFGQSSTADILRQKTIDTHSDSDTEPDTVEELDIPKKQTTASTCANKNGMYECELCGKEFKTKNHLKQHFEVHSEDRPFICNICGFAFKNKFHLTDHLRTHTGERKHTCDFCSMKFNRKHGLKRHMFRRHKSEIKFRCDVCEKILPGKESFDEHKTTCVRVEKGIFDCSYCGKVLKSKRNLKGHILTVHFKERPFKCDFCGNSFARKYILERHQRTHTGEKPYVCDLCGKRFVNDTNLKSHRKIHTKEKTHKCTLCERAFVSSSDLKKHYNVHTGVKPHECDICHKRFTFRGGLRLHKVVHTGERNYKCELCPKVFAFKSSWTIHMTIHSKVRDYKCEVCHKAFYTNSYLRVHMRTHTGKKDFKCDVCNMEFLTSDKLTRHKRKHSGEKPYKCEVCDKSYSQSGCLKRHQTKESHHLK
ncbi:hypothetical protein FSP39_019331 [Pinctada imbricata]|uniref:Zinc finger protein 865 n=1 Tax=Pinctada imbricata TaxID=66713 RepID=A0AA88YJ34_PINIB|nr:hypothetical protein FSP39_019331 [Pinctada imbricata]